MARFLSFTDAVSMTHKMIAFFNSPESDPTIMQLANKFNLKIKPDFWVQVNSINENCPDCSGCHGGSCTLGCYKTQHKGDAGNLCYWDKALEQVVGTKLIVHEMGHVVYEQIFEDDLNEQASFEQSEKFAQFMEHHFDFDMSFHPDGINLNPEVVNFALSDSAQRVGELVIGITIATIVGGIVTALVTKKLKKKI